MIHFKCPHCGHGLKVDDTLAGSRGKCPGCDEKVSVPGKPVSETKKEPLPWEDGFDYSDSDVPHPGVRTPPKPPNRVPILSKSSFESPQDSGIQKANADKGGQSAVGVGCTLMIATSLILLGMQFAGIFSRQANAIPGESTTEETNKIGAWVAAQRFVKENLKSPGTASFGSIFGDLQDFNTCVKKLGNDEYAINGWVDSQNGFGATVRTTFFVRLRNRGSDGWALIDPPVLIAR